MDTLRFNDIPEYKSWIKIKKINYGMKSIILRIKIKKNSCLESVE